MDCHKGFECCSIVIWIVSDNQQEFGSIFIEAHGMSSPPKEPFG